MQYFADQEPQTEKGKLLFYLVTCAFAQSLSSFDQTHVCGKVKSRRLRGRTGTEVLWGVRTSAV